jgi:tetratricopeptide (TPR) repeat protein
MEEMA